MILIDTREQWKEEIQNKLQAQHVNAQILKLENYADYVLTSDNKDVQNTVAIQRKTIGEVLSQFKDIQMRLPELQKYGVPWLLVEESGIFINRNGMLMSKRGKLLYETGVKAQSYYNFLHSVQRSGVSVKTTLNWEQSVWWLCSLHSYIQREHILHANKKYKQAEEVKGALEGIRGVGKETIEKIWDCYCTETSNDVTTLRIDENALSMILAVLLKRREVKEAKAADHLQNEEIAAFISATEIAQLFNITEEKNLRKLRKMLHRLTEKKKLKRKKVDGVYNYTIAAEYWENKEIAAVVSTIQSSIQRYNTLKIEEIIDVLQSVLAVDYETAQEIYVAYELLYTPFEIVAAGTSLNSTLMLNSSDVNPLVLKVFDRMLKRLEYILKGKGFIGGVATKDLKSRITRDEVLLKLFIKTLIEEGYLKNEKKGKHVYYSIRYKNTQKNIEDESEIKNVSREEEIATVEKEHKKWLEEIEEDW